MKKRFLQTMFFMIMLTFLFGMTTWATDYTEQGTYRWEIKDGLYYAFDAFTGELLTNCKVGKYYVDDNGTRYLNQFVKGVYYNAVGKQRKKFKGGWIKTGGQVYYFKNKKKLTGYQKINGKYYYFAETGERQSGILFVEGHYRYFNGKGRQVIKKGWKKIQGMKFYMTKKGYIKEGFFKVSKKQYYQTVLTGIVTGEQIIEGQVYYFKESGVYDEEATMRIRENGVLGNEADILFFTKFESGNAGYAQTGGDSGKACGKYQFDYRYALIPFLKYCYAANPIFFAEFEPFLNINAGSKSLINNEKLYKAWTNCYNTDPTYFSSMQDNYALEAYYKPAENYLMSKNINLQLRPYVIRGAVFSYAIQEGSLVAALGVIASGVSNTTSNREFLEKVYDYRWKDPKGWNSNPVFLYRYTQEKALALQILDAAIAAAAAGTAATPAA